LRSRDIREGRESEASAFESQGLHRLTFNCTTAPICANELDHARSFRFRDQL
jgi:hypothetical protein